MTTGYADKMGGFSITVELRVSMSPLTGKPFVYDSSYQHRIDLDLSTYIVPPEFQVYLEARDGVYYLYTDSNSRETAADDFYDNFPDWLEIAPKVAEDELSWTEEDHNAFRTAAAWFAERPGFFWIWA